MKTGAYVYRLAYVNYQVDAKIILLYESRNC